MLVGNTPEFRTWYKDIDKRIRTYFLKPRTWNCMKVLTARPLACIVQPLHVYITKKLDVKRTRNWVQRKGQKGTNSSKQKPKAKG